MIENIACGRGRRLTCTGGAIGGIGKVIQTHRGTASRLLFVALLVLPGLMPPRDAVAQGAVTVPDKIELVKLVRATMSALNHANFTGNYTVLRDLGAPGFRAANTAARLAANFSDLRDRNLELSPLLVVDPIFTRPASFDERGMLRITGYFPTRPQRIVFDVTYQVAKNRWRLIGISINAESAEAASALPTEPNSAPAAAAAVVPDSAPTGPIPAPAAAAAAAAVPDSAPAGLETMQSGPNVDWRQDLGTSQ